MRNCAGIERQTAVVWEAYMQKPVFLDTTLRDGEQSPGLYFTNEEKLRIARELDGLGIEIIEAGIPSMGEEERSYLCELKRMNLKSEILSWNRLLVDDVKLSLVSGMTSIHVSVPTSDIMIEKKMGKTREWIFGQMEEVISFALKEGASVSFGAEDASRTDPVFLKRVFVHAMELGVTRVRFADTLGIMTPSHVAELIGFLTEGLGISLDFHGHNDFGLATANALSAWENGADIISCSVLGLGERAGNTPLEEIAGVSRYLKGGIRDFDFVRLADLCRKVSGWIGSPIPERKPIVGGRVFTHESGIHVDGILKEPSTYEFFPPEQIGAYRKLIPGKHSGRKAIRHLAEEEGFELTDDQIDAFLKDLRSRMAHTRGVDAVLLFRNYLLDHARRVV
jgi:homocitrate synthase NifV